MIDRDEMRIARRTVERNGYTVLPPRENDEDDLNRFRSRKTFERRPVRSFSDEDDFEESQPRFKPLRSRSVDDDEPVSRRPVERKPMSDLERAKRTAEFNGYTVQKMSRLDQAKQVAQDAGYNVKKMSRLDQAKQVAQDAGFEVRKITHPIANVDDQDINNDRPIRRTATRDGAPMRRPVVDREMSKANRDAVHTRTAPDVEIKDTQKTTINQSKKPSFEDDYVNRAAAFFGDDE